MTTAARLGNVGAIDRRLWIVRRQHRRNVAILCVAIEAGSRLHAVANRLRVKAMVVSGVRGGVKKRTRQIRKLFAGAVATLALKNWRWNGRRARVWTADDCAFIRLYWSLRNIFARLRANLF